MNNNTNTNSTETENTNTINKGLTDIVRELYTQNAGVTVKEILGSIQTQHNHLAVDYRKVYNTLKRVNGSSKAPKTSKTEKSTVIFDLTAPPAYTAKGIVVKRGRRK
jgi:hypothetical protein